MTKLDEEKRTSRSDMPSVISLFSGAGGMDIGFEEAGFDTRVCLEWIPKRCETLRLNRPDWAVLEGDIRNYGTKEILKAGGLSAGEVGLVIGGPPCQAFSKSAYWVPGRLDSILDDPRALLLKEYVRVVKESRPRAFVMENVWGLAYKHGRPALDAAVAALKKQGYAIEWRVLNAVEYGVPQKRERLVVVGVRDGDAFRFPEPTHADVPRGQRRLADGLRPFVTAGDAIKDLDDVGTLDGETVRGKYGHLLKEIPPGDNYLHLTKKRGHPKPVFKWRSKYWSFLLKLSPDLPSWTIQASPGPNIGPFHWTNRRLHLSEAKRLQTFPDSWELVGSRNEQWAQVGDAVPCLLAQTIGDALQAQVFEKKTALAPIAASRRGAKR